MRCRLGYAVIQRWTMAGVESEEPSSTTRASAFQWRSATQARKRSRACSMRALSLYAGITMLRLGELTWFVGLPASVKRNGNGEFMIRHYPLMGGSDQCLPTPAILSPKHAAAPSAIAQPRFTFA